MDPIQELRLCFAGIIPLVGIYLLFRYLREPPKNLLKSTAKDTEERYKIFIIAHMKKQTESLAFIFLALSILVFFKLWDEIIGPLLGLFGPNF